MTLYYVQLFINGLIAGSVYALFAVGLTLIYGVCRFINFAHGELITWGAYLTLLFASPPFGLSLAAAALPALGITAAIGLAQDWLVYRPLRRRSSISLLIASIGLAYFLRNVIRFFWGSDLMTFDLSLSRGIMVAGLFVTRTQLMMVAAALFFMTVLWLVLTRTHLGKSLRAVSDHPELAEIMGIDLKRVYATVWILASLFAGAGGILLALDTNLEPLMGLTNLIKAFAAVLLGGAGNVWGALFGGLIIGVAENLGVAVFSTGYKDLVAFAVIF
ncbi:MAG TPA: branched-chain amino acid ABC transporter permease, partial [Desulfosarcina sp.]|nr:branched-chain amino acid ABC transporter permease [Desulfosarcina sp.]